MSEESTSRADTLLTIIKEAASAVGSRFVGFLAVGVYVGVTVFSTTDAMLVHGTVVHLPLLNVDVPIMAFYLIAPWLIVGMHSDLLLQLSLLGRKLADLRQSGENGQIPLRERLPSFYYVQFLFGYEGGEGWSLPLYALAGGVLALTVIAFPLGVLLAIQIRFLPFHSAAVTWSHRVAVIGDVLLLSIIWPQLLPPAGSVAEIAASRPLLARWSVQRLLAPVTMGLVIMLVSLFVATIPGAPSGEWFSNRAFAERDASRGIADDSGAPWMGTWWFKLRNLRLQNEVLTAVPLPPLVVNALRDGGPLQKEQQLTLVSPLSFFQGRDLCYANFVAAVMPKFDFRAFRTDTGERWPTLLRGADFSWAQMQGDWLDEVDAEGAVFDGAELQEAELTGADLRGASLNHAQLQHARLPRVRLDNQERAAAQAQGIQLQGADLSDAQLAGADLSNAQLQGASLRGADLQGATLDHANLEGADLSRALLNGAHFKSAHLRNTMLLETVVDDRTDFSDAEIDLTDVTPVSHLGSAPDVFKKAEFVECDEGQAKQFRCRSALRSEQYRHRVIDQLVHLACSDLYVARGLAEQVQYHQGVRSTDPRWSALADAMSACLHPAPSESASRSASAFAAGTDQRASGEGPG